LKAALQAGKAARDPKKVPAILPLKSYNSGEGGRYTKPEAPAVLVEIATQVSIIRVISFQSKHLLTPIIFRRIKGSC